MNPQDHSIVRIYTHNVRVAKQQCDLVEGELPWRDRRDAVAASILLHAGRGASVVCLQECLHAQLKDLLAILGDEWRAAGRGRCNGNSEGEFCPVLFKSSELQLLSERTFWLSDTPNEPSRGWDAKYPRIATRVRLATRDHTQFTVWCTHFDHKGERARERAARLLASDIGAARGVRILAGDLNSIPSDAPATTLLASGLDNTAKTATRRFGHKYTFTGFSDAQDPMTIDYIWCSQEAHTILHAVLDNQYGHANAFSDHRPVVADVRIAPHISGATYS